jgi:hypothetical protein
MQVWAVFLFYLNLVLRHIMQAMQWLESFPSLRSHHFDFFEWLTKRSKVHLHYYGMDIAPKINATW